MNDKSHWNRIAPTYNDEIFDVFASDKNKVLTQYFKKHRSKSKQTIDFGCGNGKAFPYLAPQFKSVLGVDISQRLLDQAIQRGFKNVYVQQADLTKPGLSLPKAEFAFCCNVIMFTDVLKNDHALKNISGNLKSGGVALLVLPSLESALFSSWRLIDIYRREGVSISEISEEEFHYFKGKKRDLIQGIVYIDNVATKHYTAPELEVILPEAGLTLTALERIEYEWDSELADPPTWLKGPYPWDWLVECRKR